MHLKAAAISKLLSLWTVVLCVNALTQETPEPASLLRPRDVNPHPYVSAYENINIQDKSIIENSDKFMRNLYNQGPILFPRSDVSQLPHPYEQLALKERVSKTQRFAGLDNHIIKPAYNALAKHAQRVLKNNHIYDEQDYENEASSIKKHYAFSYTVKDSASGDDFSHTQQQKDGAVKGNYKVQLPDGRMQIVKYIADNNGYRADVTYEKDGAVQESPTASATITPLAAAQPIYDYYKNLQQNYVPAYEQRQPSNDYQDNVQHKYYYPAEPKQPQIQHYQPQLHVDDVKIQNYNTAPHSNVIIATPTPTPQGTFLPYQTPSNFGFLSTTPNPVQIQTNSFTNGFLATTPSPFYRDIHVTPSSPTVGRKTTVYDQRTSRDNVYNHINYDYINLPTNQIYRRSTDEAANTSSKK